MRSGKLQKNPRINGKITIKKSPVTKRITILFLLLEIFSFCFFFCKKGAVSPWIQNSFYFVFSIAFLIVRASKQDRTIARESSSPHPKLFRAAFILHFIRGWASLIRERAILFIRLRLLKAFLSMVAFMSS